MNRIEWKPKALKQVRKIDPQHGAAIRKSVTAELTDLSQASNVKALTNHQYGYRLRVGNYRVFFDHEGGKAQVVQYHDLARLGVSHRLLGNLADNLVGAVAGENHRVLIA